MNPNNTDKEPFTFSITDNVRIAWLTYKRHIWIFIGLTVGIAILNIPEPGSGEGNLLITSIFAIVSVVYSYMCISVLLATVDHRDALLRFKTLREHIPTLRQFALYVVLGIVVAIFVTAGTIVLIIPGIYILVRLSLSQFAFIDRQYGVIDTYTYAWRLVTKDVFWTVLLTLLTAIVLIIIGAAFFGIGLLVTYPLAMLLVAQLYRALTLRTRDAAPVVVQSVDVPNDLPVIEVA